jgi:hypothetical protein
MNLLKPLLAVTLACCAPVAGAQQSCRKVVFDGSVKRGETFRRPLNQQLTFLLLPTSSGWRIEVQPSGAALSHDAAEVATPPYQSVSPLLLTTDYGFRAQDVVSWNPRQFEFATDAAIAANASKDVDTDLNPSSDAKTKQETELRLVRVAMNSAHGELQILDASLVPGTADQTAAAASVAAHWRTTPHTLLQPSAGTKASAGGSVESLRFKVTLWLPRALTLAAGLHPTSAACPQ